MQVLPTEPAHFHAAWPAVPASVPRARHAALRFLEQASTTDPPLSDIRLAVTEAVANAVLHAYVDEDPGEVRLDIALAGDEVCVAVEDDGRGLLPRVDSPGLGLGLPLIRRLSERVDTRTAPGGGTRLCAWFRLQDPAAPLAG